MGTKQEQSHGILLFQGRLSLKSHFSVYLSNLVCYLLSLVSWAINKGLMQPLDLRTRLWSTEAVQIVLLNLRILGFLGLRISKLYLLIFLLEAPKMIIKFLVLIFCLIFLLHLYRISKLYLLICCLTRAPLGHQFSHLELFKYPPSNLWADQCSKTAGQLHHHFCRPSAPTPISSVLPSLVHSTLVWS